MPDGKAQAALVGIPSDKIPLIWSEVLPLIARACKRTNGRYEPEDILGFLLSGVCQLWVCIDAEIEAVAVTEIVCYPRAKAVRVFLLAGAITESGFVLSRSLSSGPSLKVAR